MNVTDNLVTIVIPFYNSDLILFKRAIMSVIQQKHIKPKLIVVDDGSDTKDAELIINDLNKKYNLDIKYIYQQNGGVSSARNTGIKVANTKYIGFLDSDDSYTLDKLYKQVNIFERLSSDYAIVSGASIEYYTRGFRKKQILKNPVIFDGDAYNIIFPNFLNLNGTPNHLFDREKIISVGMYDENLTNHEDQDLLLRLTKKYKIFTHKDVVCFINKRIDSLSQRDTLNHSLKFLDKVEREHKVIPISTINNRRKKIYINNAIKHLNKNNFKEFKNLILTGVRKFGQPDSIKGKLVVKILQNNILSYFFRFTMHLRYYLIIILHRKRSVR